jgi:integrase
LRGRIDYGTVVSSLVPVFEQFSLRASSHKTYSSLFRHYLRFCADTGRDPSSPISETRLCEACIYFCSQRAVTGLGNYCSALQWWHSASGFGPLPRNGLFYRVSRGLKNVYGQFDKEEPAFAISLEQIDAIRSFVDLRSFEGARNWCALLFGFYGLLRAGEYTAPNIAKVRLRVKHVRAGSDGIELVVPYSKTSLTATTIRICARGDILCPVAAYCHYVSFFCRTRSADEPFFVTSASAADTSRPLTADTFVRWLKRCASQVGMDASRVSGHSLRRGGTTAMFIAGCSETVIAQHGRWRSVTYRRYFESTVPHFLATRILLLSAGQRFISSTALLPSM